MASRAPLVPVLRIISVIRIARGVLVVRVLLVPVLRIISVIRIVREVLVVRVLRAPVLRIISVIRIAQLGPSSGNEFPFLFA